MKSLTNDEKSATMKLRRNRIFDGKVYFLGGSVRFRVIHNFVLKYSIVASRQSEEYIFTSAVCFASGTFFMEFYSLRR